MKRNDGHEDMPRRRAMPQLDEVFGTGHKPLDGLLVADFSQFLSGPSAGLRLADLGARVIKIERPDGGDLCRRLYISNQELDGDSTLFHSINRNKQSLGANLKEEADRRQVLRLLEKADVMIENFRPGVIDRLGFGYEAIRAINSRIIYASITGYGRQGPWIDKPGQDLLVQSLSGLARLGGSGLGRSRSGGSGLGGTDATAPMPFGLAIADMMAGSHAVQGILACLVRRGITGKGGKVDISLLESTVDTMVAEWTEHWASETAGGLAMSRERPASRNFAGIFATADGYIAIASEGEQRIVEAAQSDAQGDSASVNDWLYECLLHLSVEEGLDWLESRDIPCAKAYTWDELLKHPGFQCLQMTQDVYRVNGTPLRTLCCPIRIDGERLTSPIGSPHIGEHTEMILKELEK
jgi:crotonobetainyl-CoA:carnitine CoA-transferase CaiB-like acyl-CoA transferase